MLTDQSLFEHAGVRIAFAGRAGGVSTGPFASLDTASHVGDDPACVERNRAILMEACGCAGAPLVVPLQVHGTHVVNVAGAADAARTQAEADEGADAVTVTAPGAVALLHSADCLVLCVVSPTGRFAVAHAGWRGAVAGIAGKAVRALVEADRQAEAGACGDPSGYNAYLGPHIGAECFEVSVDIARQFQDAFGERAIASYRHVDLAGAVAVDLIRAGICEHRICDCAICTKCNADAYYSYRAAGGECGRHATLAYWKEG